MRGLEIGGHNQLAGGDQCADARGISLQFTHQLTQKLGLTSLPPDIRFIGHVVHNCGQTMLALRRQLRILKGRNTDIKGVQVTQLPVLHGVQSRLHAVHRRRDDQPLCQLSFAESCEAGQPAQCEMQLCGAASRPIALHPLGHAGLHLVVAQQSAEGSGRVSAGDHQLRRDLLA